VTRIKDDSDVDTTNLDEIVRGVRALDARLDEVARARIAVGLGRQLDNRAIARVRRGSTSGPALAVAALRWLLPSVAAAVTVWVAVGRLPAAGTAQRDAVFSAPASMSSTSGSFDRLEVPAGTRARAHLGRADIAVLGPAQLEVTREAGADVTMRLSSGTLVGDYDGRAGGRLRIETPRLVADIVGTRFMIEATPAHARVSVAHGRVAVRGAGKPAGAPATFVSAGESWEVGAQHAEPIPDPVMHLLSAGAATDQPVETSAPIAATPSATATTRVTAPPPHRIRAAAPARQEVLAMSDEGSRRAAPEPALPAPESAVAPPNAGPALSPPAVAAPAVPLVAAPSPAELYRRAEEGMARRDAVAARRSLEEIVARYPREVTADSARFELAREALAEGATARARHWAEQLIAEGHDRSLVDSARLFTCRIAREGGKPEEARTCLETFRAEHPRSVRDQEALATLVRLAEERGACDQARALRAEHTRLYPHTAPPEADRERCPR
jgi:TolA-binding protein